MGLVERLLHHTVRIVAVHLHALQQALGVVQAIGTAKMLCETDFAAQADKLLLGEAGGNDPNPDETLTEAEFLISVLKDKIMEAVKKSSSRS